MGFFSWLGECATSIGSTIGSAIKSVACGIGSALASVGVDLGAAVKNLAPVLGKWAGHIGVAIQVISVCVDIIARICAILQKDETVADIGERALQAEENGVTLESCNNDYKAYMKRLREFELDPHKAAARPETEKLLAGSLVLEKGIEDLYPRMSTAALWPILARSASFFTPERIEAYAKMAREQNMPFGESLAKFFMPPADGQVSKKIYDFVYAAEKAFNPSATPNEIQREFKTVREECAAPEPEK